MVVAAVSLFACNNTITVSFETNGPDEVNQLGEQFYAETILQDNVKIVVEQNSEVAYTVEKDGDKVSRKTGSTTGYAYYQGGKYYAIADPRDAILYVSDTPKENTLIDDLYNAVEEVMSGYLTVSPLLFDGESSYSATYHEVMESPNRIYATIDMNVSGQQQNWDDSLIYNSNHVVAKSTNGLIQSITPDKVTGSNQANVRISVSYGNASVSIPETRGFDLVDLDE